jgi:hypothetical protein
VANPGIETGWSIQLGGGVPGATASSTVLPRIPAPTHLGKLLHVGPSPYSGHGIDEFMRCPTAWALNHPQAFGANPVMKHDSNAPLTARGLGAPPADGPVEPPEPLDARGKGSMGHVGLGHYYMRKKAVQDGTDPDVWLPADQAIAAYARKHGVYYETFGFTAQDLTRTYAGYWGLERCRIIDVEGVCYLEGLNGHKHTRSRDLVIWENGKYFIIDHKCVGRIRPNTLMRYSMSGQFLDLTLMGHQIWGAEFGGALVNLVTWPDNKNQIHFQRSAIPAAPHALRRRMGQLQKAYAERQALLDSGLPVWEWPMRTHELVCQTPYGLCDYYDLCRFGPAGAAGHSTLAVLPR